MQVSTFSVIMTKKVTYLESYIDFILQMILQTRYRWSYRRVDFILQMIFINLSVSFSPKCLVMMNPSVL